jgi:hypothetical protein
MEGREMGKLFQWCYYVLSLVAIFYMVSSNELFIKAAGLLLAVTVMGLSLSEHKKTKDSYMKSLTATLLFCCLVVFMPHKWLFKTPRK